MEILTGEQMRRIDRRAIEELGIPSLALMEAAGRGIALALLEDHPHAASSDVVVLCGKGNNGGDGLVAARHLLRAGVRSRVVVLAAPDRLTVDAAENLKRVREAGLEVREAPDEQAWSALSLALGPQTLVVDALLGTGVRGGAHGLTARVIDAVNASGATVVAVDLPSGIDADSTEVHGITIRADRTYTLCRPKLALALGAAATRAGRWRVIAIGIPDEAVHAEGSTLEWSDREALSGLWSPRKTEGHKGLYGHLLAVAGSGDKSGAAVLVARGALRSGVGLCTVATPASAQGLVAVQQAELMTAGLAETANGELALSAVDPALELARARDALAIGPGLGSSSETALAVRAIVRGSTLPLVIDADALNAFAAERSAPPDLGPVACRAVLTPHPGEAGRLLGCTTEAIQADRLGAARRLATGSGAIVVLKGHRTLVAAPDGRVAVNASGNPGLSSGGTGDVLTGVVGALLARGFGCWDAARLAVWFHGDAGDRTAARMGEDGLLASDVAGELPAALRGLLRAEESGR